MAVGCGPERTFIVSTLGRYQLCVFPFCWFVGLLLYVLFITCSEKVCNLQSGCGGTRASAVTQGHGQKRPAGPPPATADVGVGKPYCLLLPSPCVSLSTLFRACIVTFKLVQLDITSLKKKWREKGPGRITGSEPRIIFHLDSDFLSEKKRAVLIFTQKTKRSCAYHDKALGNSHTPNKS